MRGLEASPAAPQQHYDAGSVSMACEAGTQEQISLSELLYFSLWCILRKITESFELMIQVSPSLFRMKKTSTPYQE